MKHIKCPTCGKPIEWNNTFPQRPFCSERCKLIDLGAWADESHRIPGTEAKEFLPSENNRDD